MIRVSIALVSLLAASSAAAMHGRVSSLADWGALGDAAACQRAVGAAAQACIDTAIDARGDCHDAELGGGRCDTGAVAARVQAARAAALDAIERACSDEQSWRLGRAGLSELLADAMRACRTLDQRLGTAPYATRATAQGASRACVRSSAAAARRLGRFAVRAWRYAFEHIATDALSVDQKDRIAARAAERIARVQRVLAAQLERRCGARFAALYQRTPAQLLAEAAESGNCFSGAVYAQEAVTCAETAAAQAVSGICTDGAAAEYPCANVNLRAFLPLGSIGGGGGNDVWGWTDAQSAREYVLMGRSNGTAFVDITANPPAYLGNLPTHSVNSIWRGIKVHADHAFIGSEAGGHGMQVFDLTQLRSVTQALTFGETTHYAGFGNSHTLAINNSTGFLYAAGTNTCSGGLHIVDVRNPRQPTFAGCVNNDGYTHETQCVVYRGPDSGHFNREICLSSNADTLTIVDVTDKSTPVQLSRTGYDGLGYTHQGWLTGDQRYFLVNDELDERNFGHNTRTHIWDVADLDAPVRIGFYTGPTAATDHNLYVRGRHVFEANYRSGLRILDATDVATATLREVGFFDIYPTSDSSGFNGAWSTYPFFASGLVAVSGIEQGLFVLEPAVDGTPTPTPTSTPLPTSTITATRTATAQSLAAADVVVTVPSEGQVIGVEGVTFAWTTAAGATVYDLRIVNAATQAVIFTGTLSGADATTTLIGLPNNGSYTFRVRACMGVISAGTCGNFATRNFSVSLVTPAAAPTITFPAQGATLSSSQQTLSWTTVAGNPVLPDLFYEVRLMNLMTGLIEHQFRTIHPTAQAGIILRTALYRMQVRACQSGCGPFSTAIDFGVALGAVPNTAPTITNAMVSGGNSLSVSWTAVGGAEWYQLQVIQPGAGPGGGALTVAARQVNGTSVVLPVPAGQASVIVAACNGDGCGPSSSVSMVTPTSNPAAPQIGVPLDGAFVNGPSVIFAWSRIPGDTGSTVYRLYVQDLSRQRAALDILTTENFYGALLKAEGGRYAAVVIAHPTLANQIASPPVTFTVRGTSAVAPTMTAPTHGSVLPEGNVLVGWSPVAGATLYEYLLSVQGEALASERGVTQGTFVQVPLSAGGGSPTTYNGIVRACPAGQTCVSGSDAGWGPWSSDAGSGVVAFNVLPISAPVGGSSLRFQGNGEDDIDRVKIALAAPRPVDVGGDFTIEFWMKTSAGNASGTCTAGGDNWINGNIIFDRDVFGAGDLGDYGISLFGNGGRLAFGVAVGNDGQTICGTHDVANGQWHHVAVTRASLGAMRIYVDGQLSASGTGPAGDISYQDGPPDSPADPFLVIGAEKHDAGAAFPSFHGWIDEVRISGALRYASPFTAPTAPLASDIYTVALYHFDEGNGNVIVDSSGAAGGPSDGVRRFGGSPAGPQWSPDTPFTSSVPQITFDTLTTALSSPTSVTHAGDQRLFITEKGGTIRIWDGAQLLATPFLTISPVAMGAEEGLFSMAFHPNYASNGRFYVYYVNGAGNLVIARYTVSANPNVANPAGSILLTIPHPDGNHNGGQLQFGPDGYLYAGIGDGGGGCDSAGAGCNAQRDNLLLGKMLRLDVDQNVGGTPFYGIPPTNPYVGAGDPLDEIWAKGLRNPWRFSFDRLTGSMLIGDVGQGQREEVDLEFAGGSGGRNYGWKRMEGFACNTCSLTNCPVAPPPCNDPALTLPVLDYTHSSGCSITGGYVYRGSEVPFLYGKYLFADLCNGNLWWARDNEGVWSLTLFPQTLSGPWSFGEDVDGEVYVVRGNGSLVRLRGP